MPERLRRDESISIAFRLGPNGESGDFYQLAGLVIDFLPGTGTGSGIWQGPI